MHLFGICSVIEVLKYIQSLHSSSRLFNTFCLVENLFNFNMVIGTAAKSPSDAFNEI